MPTYFEALILGIVEGLTEFLPVSSTGHLILTTHFMKMQSVGAFEMVIQAGAIAAVIWHYRDSFFPTLRGALKFRGLEYTAWLKVFVAFLPAAVIALSFSDFIKSKLFGLMPVVGALIVGGIVMIVVERMYPAKNAKDLTTEREDLLSLSEKLSFKQALGIGLFQCFALWPGTSRSMSTILGGRVMKLSPKQAAAFSFWLAIPTLIGASLYDMLKYREFFAQADSFGPVIVATFVSFLVALVVIRAFLGFLQRNSLEVFGWYRILFGAAVYFLAA